MKLTKNDFTKKELYMTLKEFYQRNGLSHSGIQKTGTVGKFDVYQDNIDEKIRLLKLYMDVLNVGGCDTQQEELEYLEHAFNQGL